MESDRTDGRAATAGFTAKGLGGIMLAASVGEGVLVPEGRVGPQGGFMGSEIRARNMASFAGASA